MSADSITAASPEVMSLRQRVEQLERGARRVRLSGTIAALLIALIALTGQTTARTPPQEVVAEKFIVKDKKGRTVAMLGNDGGAGVFEVESADGALRVQLGAATMVGAAMSVTLRNRDGVILGFGGGRGGPQLQMFDSNGALVWRAP